MNNSSPLSSRVFPYLFAAVVVGVAAWAVARTVQVNFETSKRVAAYQDIEKMVKRIEEDLEGLQVVSFGNVLILGQAGVKPGTGPQVGYMLEQPEAGQPRVVRIHTGPSGTVQDTSVMVEGVEAVEFLQATRKEAPTFFSGSKPGVEITVTMRKTPDGVQDRLTRFLQFSDR